MSLTIRLDGKELERLPGEILPLSRWTFALWSWWPYPAKEFVLSVRLCDALINWNSFWLLWGFYGFIYPYACANYDLYNQLVQMRNSHHIYTITTMILTARLQWCVTVFTLTPLLAVIVWNVSHMLLSGVLFCKLTWLEEVKKRVQKLEGIHFSLDMSCMRHLWQLLSRECGQVMLASKDSFITVKQFCRLSLLPGSYIFKKRRKIMMLILLSRNFDPKVRKA